MEKKTTTIKQTTFIPARPEEVYDALMNAERHTEFTSSKAICDPKVGGKFTAWDGYISGKNLELTMGKRIVQEWKTTEWPAGYPPSVLEFSFKEEGDGTQLAMVHSKVPASQAESYRQGWIDAYWNPLKAYFEKRHP